MGLCHVPGHHLVLNRQLTRTSAMMGATMVAKYAINLEICPSMDHRPHLPAARTPFAFVQSVMTAYAQRRLDAATALEKAQIAPDAAGRWPPRVSSLQFERLCAAAMQELDDEALGWFSRPLPWGSYGMLARASISAPSLRVALRRWCRHHGLLTRDVVLALAEDEGAGGTASVTVREHRDMGALREFALVSLLRNVHGLSCWLVDSHIPLRAAEFPVPRPPHADVYAPLFPGPVRFDAPAAALRFDAAYLDLPLRRDEAALAQMLRRALPIMVLPYRRDRLLALRVGQLLRQHPDHSTESLAAALNLSPRTMQRQLATEGTSLQILKDNTRREYAIDLLQRTRRPIKQVALAAGFQNEKSFIRAFKSWTGLAPGAFRRAG